MLKIYFLSFGFFLMLKVKAQSEVTFSDNATNVFAITKDSLILTTGSTYAFTIDTPEDEGLVSTAVSVAEINKEIKSEKGIHLQYKITDQYGNNRSKGFIQENDQLVVTSADGRDHRKYAIGIRKGAKSGILTLDRNKLTINTLGDLALSFTAGQRTPKATIKIELPLGIYPTLENTTVDVIGRGAVKLRDLSSQSIGRIGSAYSYTKVGDVKIETSRSGKSIIVFENIDLRPYNGIDLKIIIHDVMLTKLGKYPFKAIYTTSQPEVLVSPGAGTEVAFMSVVESISDFERVMDEDKRYTQILNVSDKVNFKWTPSDKNQKIELLYSLDKGKNWSVSKATIDSKKGKASLKDLSPNQLYFFKLKSTKGTKPFYSNEAYFLSGKLDVKSLGVTGETGTDDTEKINKAIDSLSHLGGGILLFSEGEYGVRTIHLKSNVWLYIGREATIKALPGTDQPRPTWFSNIQYRYGISPTQIGPYVNPDNWLTKQGMGQTYFANAMFFAERQQNIKIIGNGRISGNNNLYTGNSVADRPMNKRGNKIFSIKLCHNIEIGGLYREEDLWYDEEKDEPYYIQKGKKDFNIDNMLHIDQGGHFALLAKGTDSINVHNTYFGKATSLGARDIYDFLQCNKVVATNIYSKMSGDDIIKLGSDCSLGFTRPVSNFMVRNIIGDTGANLFQIGSETADDITNVHVDNIFVLGANKSGFSISTNDGGYVKDIHLNCGHTGAIHSRSKMYRTTTPFFISISNRARMLGATVARYQFKEHGIQHDELLATNVSIGKVENIILNGVDISEVYRGSSFRNEDVRWGPYEGSQERATPIVAGYKLPESDLVKGGLNFTLPNGEHTGYVKNINFNDINILVKGGNNLEDINNVPPELGVGLYNVKDLKVQPSYGLWIRHVKELEIENCTFNYEKGDSRYPLFLDDVIGAKIKKVKVVCATDNQFVLGMKQASNVKLKSITCFDDKWDNSPTYISNEFHKEGDDRIPIPDK